MLDFMHILLLFCLTGEQATSPFPRGYKGPIGVAGVHQTYEALTHQDQIPVTAMDAVVAPNGALALLEGDSQFIYVWNKEGRFVSRLGGQGHGPGEFENAHFLTLTPRFLCVYLFSGNVHVFQADAQGRFSNEQAYVIDAPKGFPRVYMTLGNDQILVGRSKKGGIETPLVFDLLDPITRTSKPLPHLTIQPTVRLLDLANMSNPAEALSPGMPRLFAARRGADGALVGYGETNRLSILDANGGIVGTERPQLPRFPITPEDADRFNQTPIAVLNKTPQQLADEMGVRLLFKKEGYTSYFTHFQDYPDTQLFFIAAMGGFQMSDYIFDGEHCVVFDKKAQEVRARGRLQLEQDARLFCGDDRLLLVSFNEKDRMYVRSVTLGPARSEN